MFLLELRIDGACLIAGGVAEEVPMRDGICVSHLGG